MYLYLINQSNTTTIFEQQKGLTDFILESYEDIYNILYMYIN